MTITISAIDSEFAVATGSNVNSGSGTSTFDYPPTSSNGLVITSNEGDSSPQQFSLGDTYDLIYGNGGGGKGGTFDDAVVIRSDELPGGGHVVVFEGTNQDGDVEQIVWTPEFDLEGWYFDNFDKGYSPQFHTKDQSTSSEYKYVCFASETLIATAGGEIAAGDLRLGDLVETLDHGFQPIIWIGRRKIRINNRSGPSTPIVIQPNEATDGKLSRNVIVSAQHRLLLRDADGIEKLAPAIAFLKTQGVRRMRGRREIEYTSLLFAQHEILNVSGLAAESFFPGPQGFRLLGGREVLEVRRALATHSIAGSGQEMLPARPFLGGSSGRRALAAGSRLSGFNGCSNSAGRCLIR